MSDAKLQISADDAPLVAALGRAQAATTESVNRIKTSLESINSSFAKVQGAFAMLTAALAGGALLKGAIDSAKEWNGNAVLLAKALGTTTEQASIYETALHHVGIGADVMVDASQKMSKQIYSNGAAFEAMGIHVKDANGHFLGAGEVLRETIAKLAEIKNPIEQNIAGAQLFGKSWAEVRPLMKLTADVMAESEKRARELGLIVGPEGAAKAKAYKEAMADVDLVGKSLSIQMGNVLLPILTNLGSAFASEGGAISEVFGNVLKGIAIIAVNVGAGFETLGLRLGGLVAAGVAVLHGNLSEAKSIIKDMSTEIATVDAKAQAMIEKIKSPPPAARSAAPDLDSGKNPFGQKEKAHHDESLRYLQEYNRIRLQLTMKEIDDEGRELEASLKVDETVAETKQKLALLELDQEKEHLAARLQAGQITRAQEVAGEVAIEERKFQVEAQGLRNRLQMVSIDAQERARLMGQLQVLEQTHALATQKIQDKLASSTKNIWASMAQAMGHSVEQAFAGIVKGTETVGQAIRNMLTQLLSKMAEVMVQRLVQHAISKLLNKEEQRSEAAAAAAAAMKSAAAVPVIGWLLAPIAGAATYAAAIGFSAAQGYDIPAGINPVTQLHAREMVLPARQADVIRNMADGGGSGGGGKQTHNYHINAFDSRSFHRYLRNNKEAVKDILQEIAKDGRFSLA